MSLINQVLKDLERRQAPEHTGPARTVRPSRRRGAPFAVWWIIAAVGIGAALHWILAMETPPHPPQPEIVHAAFEADEVTPTSVPSPGANPEPSVEEADIAAPPPDTAITAATEHADAVPAPEPEPSPIELAAEKPAAPDTTEPIAAPPRANARIESEAASSNQTISIERADDGREHSDIDTARRAIARGHHRQAERDLRELLGQHPDHDEARELLAIDLVRRERVPAAIDVLEQGLDSGREPVRFAHRLGRILLEQGRVQQALTVLVEHAPSPAHDPEFQQLLAAAHRQAGDHLGAEAAYRRLTEAMPQRPAAWIGLGVSLEALDRPSEARQAYSRVMEIDDPQATRFARQRLRAIQALDGDRS